MSKIVMLFALIFHILTSSLSLASSCPIVQHFPHTSVQVLSNGTEVKLPCKSDNFDVYAIMAWLDYDKTMKLVESQGASGFPLRFNGKAVGMFMVYQYHQSDMGPFNEVYFLTPMSKKKGNQTGGTLSSLLKLNKLKRHHSKSPVDDVYFYYFSVFSGTKNAQLGSREIWGIDSILADIRVENMDQKAGESFSINVSGVEWLSFKAKKKSRYFLSQSGNLNLLIAGTSPIGSGPLYSPVVSCGRFKIGRIRAKNHELKLGNNPLQETMQSLGFDPFWIGKSLGMQAVQMPPRP